MKAHASGNSMKSARPRTISRNISRQQVPSGSWKVAKYYDNSGTMNPIIMKNNSEVKIKALRMSPVPRYAHWWPQHSLDANSKTRCEKSYGSNFESTQGWDPAIQKTSMINYQGRDYNFITHTSANRPTTMTTYRQKGFGEYVNSSRPNKKEYSLAYQDVLKNNPKVFFRQSGVFTQHQDCCKKLSGFGPFHNPLS